jgi:hypothetical protein
VITGGKCFVWVWGTSGVGKETTVKAMVEDLAHPVARAVGLTNPVASKTSLAIRGHQGRGELDLVSILIEELEQSQASELVIKWQRVDCGRGEYNRMLELRERRPEDQHKFVFLIADVATLQEHTYNREPNEKWRSLDHQPEAEMCLALAKEVQEEGVEFIWFEVSLDGQYKLIPNPLV